MTFWKRSALFVTGGCSYVGLELLWRGWSHGSMFLAGGSAFLLLGGLGRRVRSLPVRAVVGAGVITAVELAVGLIANRDYGVWDYRHVPGNFCGQICLPYCLLWMPVSLIGMDLYAVLERKLLQKTRQ